MNQTTQPNQPVISNIVDLDHLPSMDDLLSEGSSETFAAGTLTTGKVVDKRENSIIVDIGYKAEGVVDRDEVVDFDSLEIGQQIDVFIEILEDEDHEMPLLSVRKAESIKAWSELLENYQEGDTVRGVVRRRVKGGLIVDVSGVEAFLPGSQVDIGPVKNLDDYLDQELEFKLVKISQERRNLVVSRRELIEESRAEQRAALLNELQVGDLRTGQVKNITDFGAFVDLSGMDGLLHITDMSWGRIGHPSEMVDIGDEVEVMILDIDHEKQRVSLGLKQKEGNPWDDVKDKYPAGSRMHGQVVNVMPYGAFVELEQGIEGLIHVSEMSWTKRVNRASDVLSVGDEVDAMVLDVQQGERKISLGLRQLTENPWEKLAEQFPQGSKVKGPVRNMTAYGAFVQIQDDIDGMIHVSDMSWTRKVSHPGDVLEKGQEVEAVVLSIDPDQQRISLGLKQLTEDPWNRIEEYYKVGDVVEGKVTKIASFGAFVELANGVEGLIHISQLSEEHVKRVKDVLSVDQQVTARVIKVDQEEKRVGLSIKAVSEEYLAGLESGELSQLRPGEEIGGFSHLIDSALEEEQTAVSEGEGAAAAAKSAESASDEKAEEKSGEQDAAGQQEEQPAATDESGEPLEGGDAEPTADSETPEVDQAQEAEAGSEPPAKTEETPSEPPVADTVPEEGKSAEESTEAAEKPAAKGAAADKAKNPAKAKKATTTARKGATRTTKATGKAVAGKKTEKSDGKQEKQAPASDDGQ